MADGETREVPFALVLPSSRTRATPGRVEQWSLRVGETAELMEIIVVGLKVLRRAQRQIESPRRNHRRNPNYSGRAPLQ